jgi:predicted ester cyclase
LRHDPVSSKTEKNAREFAMTYEKLRAFYLDYIACLNAQNWDSLENFVSDCVAHNGRAFGLSGYREMLIGDFQAIPDLAFDIATLVCEPPMIASRLAFDCTPVGTLCDIPVNGRRIQFDENVFYQMEAGKIRRVWSVIDTAAIARQVAGQSTA